MGPAVGDRLSKHTQRFDLPSASPPPSPCKQERINGFLYTFTGLTAALDGECLSDPNAVRLTRVVCFESEPEVLSVRLVGEND